MKEEIKARLPVEDVIGRYLELKRAGRNLKALSPFTNEKTPSFMVSPERNVWHDYSSGKGGDIFQFVMEVEGLGFVEALKLCAGWAGVNLELYDSASDRELAAKTKRMREILEASTKYYQFALSKNPPVLDYAFYKRNLNKKSVADFRIGYAPASGDALCQFLASRGFTEREAEDAGLLNRRKNDLFRARLMIPLSDQNGNIVGYTARILDDKIKDSPKYLNSPETLLYHKSRHVFGLAQAKKAIIASGYAVLVEGNMDVISSHQGGVKEAVATAGTAMTSEHLKGLARFAKDLRIAYDSDAAGLKATERAIILSSGLGLHLRVIADYGAKDPDELIQRDPKLWQEAVEKPQAAMEWLMDEYAKRFDVESGAGKREYAEAMIGIINSVPDELEREAYQQNLAARLQVKSEVLAKKSRALEKPARLKQVQTKKTAAVSLPLENLLALYAWLKESDEKLFMELKSDEILDQHGEILYTRLNELALRAENRYNGWSKERLQQEMRMLTGKIKEVESSWRQAELSGAIEAAEADGDTETVDLLLAEMNKLNNRKE